MRTPIASACLLVMACKGEVRPPDAAPPAAETASELALQVSDTMAVWFTSARTDTAAAGTECRERVMEVRVRDRVIPVPLLYTAEIPTITNDSTFEVHIWRHCVPADLYRVNLRTGQPTRVGT